MDGFRLRLLWKRALEAPCVKAVAWPVSRVFQSVGVGYYIG